MDRRTRPGRRRREKRRGQRQRALPDQSSEYTRHNEACNLTPQHTQHTKQATTQHTRKTMDLLRTPPRAAASFAGVDTTKTQEGAVPPSSLSKSAISSRLDAKEEGTPAAVDALTCFATLSFLFSPFLGPKDCLTMAGLQKVRRGGREGGEGGGGWIGGVCAI